MVAKKLINYFAYGKAVGLKAEVHHQSEEEEPLTPSPSAARLPPKQRSVTEHLQQQRQQEEDFVIPELPSGKSLVLDITSTWGDRHYLGLNGIEIFSVTGELVQISDTRANPADINILPEYGGKDPRVAANLTDRVNRTRDDMHLWLTPFTQGKHHFVNITFAKVETIAMIRIWNYNKSRIHSYRGAKDVTITLDGRMIFKGEIARASGGILGATDSFGDTILYTTEDSILERVAENDDSFNSVMNLSVPEPAVTISNDRPLTADIGDVRPLTCVGVDNLGSWGSCGAVLVLQEVALRLVSSWQANGHARLGLTGLDVLGETGQPVRVATIETDPPTTDPHILARLLDGSNETTNEDEMWIADGPPPVTVHLKFTSPVHVCAIVVWNYNASPELSYCGVRQIEIYVDNKLLKEDVLVRKAPGHCQYPIGQRIGLALAQHNHSAGATAHQPHQPPQPLLKYTLYTPSEMPSGFVFQLVLLSTWGDHYYVGLNGIEFYDPNCRIIQLSENNICAYPASVNILEDSGGKDVRTPDKLIDGINNTTDGSHMWLAPILPGKLNSVYVIFDVSTTVSMIKLWNYAKTPTRGVKEFGILVDDLLVYNGVLDKVNLNTTYSEGSKPCHVPYRTVIFSREKETTAKGRNPTLG
ncbi:hypothetical protein AAG570_011671 [Ranatra chinensis]|uniref:KATNIP domain-containing protein n=1 Tax=Ranatra chinensis TaxID=642074 RepID=A0ABD0YYX8_9HEMI